jgi:hypothetical protein
MEDYSSDSYSSVQSAASTSCFLLSVSNSCPAGHAATFTVTISDGSNNSWTDTFVLNVASIGATVEYSASDIYDGTYYSATGNGDGIINKGETVRLNVELKNTGTSAANNLSATLSTTDSYITVSPASATHSYGTINAGYYKDMEDYSSDSYSSVQSAASTTCFLFTVSSSCPTAHIVNFSLDISDSNNNSWSDIFTLTVYY